MAWLKLQKVGDTATIFVKSCGESPGRLGPQFRFQSDKGEDIYLPLDVAQSWLLKLGLANREQLGVIDYNRVCGNYIRFARVAAPNPDDRPHWHLSLPTHATTTSSVHPEGSPVTINDHLPPATGVPSAPAVSSKAQRREAIADAYTWAHETVRRIQYEYGKGKGRGATTPTAESVEQGVTTLMLRAERMDAI